MSPQVSRFIDTARWLAAFAVLFTHVESYALVTLADTPAKDRGAAAYVVWFLYGYAHQAVVVFFVVSGFLVGGKVLRAVAGSKFLLRPYLIDRTVRIYVVLLPVLVATALLDLAGRRLFADTGIYRLPIFAGRSGVGDFFANLLNIQDIFVPYFGTNSALWTLSHEYWYYVTFALLAAAFMRSAAPMTRTACAASGLVLLAALSASLSYHLFGFMLWMAGALAAFLGRPLLRSRRLALLAFLGICVGLRLFVRYSALEEWWVGGLADLAVALSFANLLLTLRFDELPVWLFGRWRLHKSMSDFSYSLYAVHMPVVVLLCAASQHWLGFGWQSVPNAPSRWFLATAVLAVAIGSGYAFSRATEAHTQVVRRLFHRLFAARGEVPEKDANPRRAAAASRNAVAVGCSD
jgi:peptidoglycan/LPS O-acetylase OafA/YrhL